MHAGLESQPSTLNANTLCHQRLLPALTLTGNAIATAAPTCVDSPDHTQVNASIHSPNNEPAVKNTGKQDAVSHRCCAMQPLRLAVTLSYQPHLLTLLVPTQQLLSCVDHAAHVKPGSTWAATDCHL